MFQKISKNIFFGLLGYLWPAALMFITTPIVLNGLGEEINGIWYSIGNVFSYLALFNVMSVAGIKYLAEFIAQKDWDHVRKLLGTSLLFDLIAGVLSLVGIIAAAEYLATQLFKISPSLQTLGISAFRLSGWAFFFIALGWWGSALLIGLQRFDWAAAVQIINTTVMYVGSAIVVKLGWGLIGVVSISIVGYGLSDLIYLILYFKLLPPEGKKLALDGGTLKRIAGYSFFSSLQMIFGLVTLQLDRTLLAIWSGAASVTYYGTTANLAKYIHTLCAKGLEFIFPMSSELMASKDFDKLRSFFLRAQTINTVLVFLFSVPLFVYSHELLQFWLDNPTFADKATLIMRILVIGYSILALNVTVSGFANGMGHPEVNTAFAVVLAFFSFSGYMLFIKAWGPVGASLAAAGAMFLSVTPLIIYVNKKYLHTPWWPLLKTAFLSPFGVALLTGAAFWFTKPLAGGLASLLFLLAACCSVYLLLVYFLNVLSPDEKQMIRDLIRRVLQKISLRFKQEK